MANPNIPPNIDIIFSRARKGDQDAEARLVEIYSYLIDQIVKPEDDDARSHAYVGLISGIRKYNPDNPYDAQPQTYIAMCIRHAVGKVYQRRQRDTERLLWLDSNDTDTDSAEIWRIDHDNDNDEQIIDRVLLLEIVASLPERDQQILKLYAEGWRIIDIAKKVGVCRAWLHCLINDIRTRIGLTALEDWGAEADEDQTESEGEGSSPEAFTTVNHYPFAA